VTWTEAKIVPDGIYGQVGDFTRLAEAIGHLVANAEVGDRIRIDEVYSKASEVGFDLLLESDDFEAASADPALATT
jgi:hypothetical protein